MFRRRRLLALLCFLAVTLRMSGVCEAMMLAAPVPECCERVADCPSHSSGSEDVPEPLAPSAPAPCCIVASESGAPVLPAPSTGKVPGVAPVVPIRLMPGLAPVRRGVPPRSSPRRHAAPPAHILFAVFLV